MQPGKFSEPNHDHGHCVANALADAETICRARGVRLTKQRRQVLEIVWAGHAPVGAYHILAALSVLDGRAAAPPTVYRALDFLQAHGLVHKIESRKAYVGCQNPGEAHVGQFLICEGCGNAAEIDSRTITSVIEVQAKEVGFSVEGITLEVHGHCSICLEIPQSKA